MGLITSTQQSYYDSGSFGGYQFTSLKDVIDNFMATYVGSGKLLENTNRADVTFHAMRAMQELSFDTFKSCKAQEIEVPPSLVMPIPQDYVNYVELSWSDTSGVKHIIYPTSKTSNPTNFHQDDDGNFMFYDTGSLQRSGNLLTNGDLEGTEYANGKFNLNVNPITGVANTNPQGTGNIAAAPGTDGTGGDGDKSEGFFYNKNKIQGYNLPLDQGFLIGALPIKEDEKYTLSYTVSRYLWRSFKLCVFIIIRKNPLISTFCITANSIT